MVEPEVPVLIVPELRDDTARQDTLNRILDAFTSYRNWRIANKDNYWRAFYRAYRGIKTNTMSPYKNTMIIRELFRQVETQVPQIAEQLLGQDRNFKFKPRVPEEEEDSLAATEVVARQIGAQGLEKKLYLAIHTTIVYGDCFLQPYWAKFKRTKWKTSVLYDESTGSKRWNRKSTEVLEDSPDADLLPPWMVFAHPDVERIQDSPHTFVRRMVSSDDLKTLVREQMLDADVVEEAINNPAGGQVREILEDNPTAAGTGNYKSSAVYDLNVDTTDMHDLIWDYTNDGMEYAVIDKQYIACARRCPYGRHSLLHMKNYPQVGELYGISELMLIIEDQKILNDIMGMVMDGIHITGNPMFKVQTSSAAEWKRTVFRPGGHVVLEKMDGVEPFVTSPMPVEQTMAFAGWVMQRMKLTTGNTDELAGAGSAQKTATGLVRLQDAAGVRIKNKVKNFFMPTFEEFYQWLFLLNAMYLETEQAVRMVGSDGADVFKRFKPEVFNIDVDVDVELANTMESGPEAAGKWMSMITGFGQDPLINRKTLYDRLFRAMGERKLRPFFASSAEAQKDALKDIQQVMANGYITEAQPGDDHQTHVMVKQMFMATPLFQETAMDRPDWAKALADNVAMHMKYMQEQMAAQEQAAQTQMTPNGPGAVLPEANERAQGMFDMAQMGAQQGGGGY